MTSIGVGIYIFKTTGYTTPLMLMAFFNELPGMLGSSLAGVWVDRWDRRKVMLFADLGQAVGSVLLIISFLSGQFQLWQLYLIVFIQGVFAIFQGPAENAAITVLVPEGQRERANALREMAFPFAGVIAPVFAGLVFAVSGIVGILAADLLTFLAAVIALSLMHIPSPALSELGQADQGHFWREMSNGFSFLGRTSSLLILILYMALTYFLLNGPLELAIPYLLTITGNEAILGLFLGVMSLGAFCGAALIMIWPGRRPRLNLLLAGMLVNGAMLMIFGMTSSSIVLGLSLFLLMLPLPVSNALFNSILQLKTPPDMQGRIFSIVSQLAFLGSTTSFLLTGYLVDQVLKPAPESSGTGQVGAVLSSQPGGGMSLVLVTAGFIMLLATLVIAAWPRVRRLEALLPDYPAIS